MTFTTTNISVARALQRIASALLLLGGVILTVNARPVSNVRLSRHAQGADAISVLGHHLPTVARAYGIEAQKLATMLQTQRSLGVDAEGGLIFACDGLAVDEETDRVRRRRHDPNNAMPASSSTMQIATGSTVDAFQLHSLPGATRVIYLDFDGASTSGTSWNSSYTGGATIVSAPFDLDGDPASFNATERAVILAIWKRVAEDYAPFAIDVTTQDPGVEVLRKTSSSDTAYGIRVIISPTNWYGGAGGTAYIGSFNWSSDTPCWVFTQQLANHEKYIGEAVAHEVGHTLGLLHDGVGGSAPSEYYYGQGNWAPIMGVGYYKPITQFSKGDYTTATNLQDDFAVIAGYAPLVSDDHGNTLGAATVISGPTVATGGTIETRTDVDLFRFDTGAGAIALSITSPSVETDLHLQAELLNSAGQVLQTNATSSLNATFTATLPAGTYYLRLGGIGFGDPNTTGYTDYGSVGNYLITGTLVAITGSQAPIARASASTTSGPAPLTVAFSGQASTDADGTLVSYAWNFGNGSNSSAINPSCTYNSAGTYIAVLTVTDNHGLTSSASVAITVAAPANQAPIAAASANVTSGTAPLPIAFSSAGSSDADGSIASYLWNFGDGTTSTAASPAKTYSAPGAYTARLTITDNAGATASATVAVSVTSAPVTVTTIDVSQYSLARSTSFSGVAAVATVVVRDNQSRPVAGVTVKIQWSGLVSGSSSGSTNANGQVKLTSKSTWKSGKITGTITSVTPPAGKIYNSGLHSAPNTFSITTK